MSKITGLSSSIGKSSPKTSKVARLKFLHETRAGQHNTNIQLKHSITRPHSQKHYRVQPKDTLDSLHKFFSCESDENKISYHYHNCAFCALGALLIGTKAIPVKAVGQMQNSLQTQTPSQSIKVGPSHQTTYYEVPLHHHTRLSSLFTYVCPHYIRSSRFKINALVYQPMCNTKFLINQTQKGIKVLIIVLPPNQKKHHHKQSIFSGYGKVDISYLLGDQIASLPYSISPIPPRKSSMGTFQTKQLKQSLTQYTCLV